VPLPEECVIVFDLDDTLYLERDFVRSGLQAVSRHAAPQSRDTFFDWLWAVFELGSTDPIAEALRYFQLSFDKHLLVDIYRNHVPDLSVDTSTIRFLMQLKQADHSLGLLTDGRSKTQRNKIVALGLGQMFDEIVVSEEFGSAKPDEKNYRYFQSRFAGRPCVYVGDNLLKDFVTPNRLGWRTVGVRDRGQNIHPQELANCPATHLPDFWIESIA
jgi:putative hydrolase of the HAD superfamily